MRATDKRLPDPFRIDTDKQRADAIAVVDMLRSLADGFYRRAAQIGVHSFIEHTGLMNEHIKVLQRAIAEGHDPRAINVHCTHLPTKMKSYEGNYLAEKFCCIFLPILGREGWDAFKAHVEGELREHGELPASESEADEPSELRDAAE